VKSPKIRIAMNNKIKIERMICIMWSILRRYIFDPSFLFFL
jgi:hypothetical protein